MLKYGVYARKSHDKREVTQKSTGEQIAEAEALALRENLEIVWREEESKSAMKPGVRPKYAELIRLIQKGEVNAILCWHVNRLARNMEEGGALVQLLVDGLIREIRTPHACYRTQESILPIVIEAACASQSSIDQKHIVKRSMGGNFKSGGWNHKAPPGYINVRDRLNSKKGQVVPDRKRFHSIEKAWHLMLSGTASETDICRKLSDEWGYRTRETLCRASGTMSFCSVQAMFRNVFYAGYVKERGQILRGRHQPMITLDQFQQVQRILASRSRRANRQYEHPYTGILYCGYCGQSITAELKRLRSGDIWEGYHCSDSRNHCTKKGLSLTKLDQNLTVLLRSVGVLPAAKRVALDEIRRHLESHEERYHANLASLQDALKDVKSRQERLAQMWISGLLSDPERFKKLELGLQRESEKIQVELSSGLSQDATLRQRLARLEGFYEDLESLPDEPCEQKRSILRALGLITFFGHDKRIELNLRPVLREFVQFASQFRPVIEPPERGSGKQNRAAVERSLCFGGGKQDGIEVPDSLVAALMEDPLPASQVDRP